MALAWARAALFGKGAAEGAERATLPTTAAAPAGAASGALPCAGGSGAERATPPREAARSAPLSARNTLHAVLAAAPRARAGCIRAPAAASAAAATARRALQSGLGAGDAERATPEPEAADCGARAASPGALARRGHLSSRATTGFSFAWPSQRVTT